jgi:hypothetical protein
MKFDEFIKKVKVDFYVNEKKYVISKTEDVPNISNKIFALINDKKEVTVIAEEGFKTQSICEEKFFNLITFGVKLPFNLTGFISYVSTSLANEDVPVFTISAFSTDHIFVREENLKKTI